MITRELVAAVMPHASDEALALYVPHLAAAAAEFQINTPARVAAFLAAIAEETGELETVSENLNYSAEGLANTWPNRYAQQEGGAYVRDSRGRYMPNPLAVHLHRRPEAIANNVYADRMGNRGEESGDGWKYRGAGGIQETGKENHFAAAMFFDVDPERIGEWLRSPEGAMRSAARGFVRRGCLALADAGDFDGVSDVINRGRKTPRVGDSIGWTKRLAYFNAARKALA